MIPAETFQVLVGQVTDPADVHIVFDVGHLDATGQGVALGSLDEVSV